MQSDAKTVAAYLKSLAPERAIVISEIRKLVNQHIKSGFVETMRWGMISWEIPLDKYPNTYNKQPLNYIALAAQKNNYSLYLMSCYATREEGEAFEKAYRASGKKMDMGKSCVRFKKIEDLPIPLIVKYIKRYSLKEFIEVYEESRK
ncbi:MAG: hypothetical protein RLZZ545_680 [Actinomycetota bacterium]|jgi:hypothetical protein